jgi:uncharacterized membrane protein YbhN (UPF0104 family)
MAVRNERRLPYLALPDETAEAPPLTRGARIAQFLQRHRVLLRRFGVAASVGIIAISVFVFFRTVIQVDPRQLEAAIAGTGGDQIAMAFAFSALSYLALTGYDALALRHLRLQVPYRISALASFASYSISFTLGFPLITGGAVRYWIYGPAGLSAGKVASLTVIAGITFWLGMGLIVGVGLIGDAAAIAEINQFKVVVNQSIGVAVVGALVAYLIWVWARRRRSRRRVLSIALPGPWLTLGQMALGVIDVCSAAGALYVLLPKGHGLAFVTFSALYSFACMLGIASHAPGGIGVFEAAMLKTVPAPPGALLASLLLFRAVYYLAPFILAMALLGAHEAGRRWRSLREAMEAPDDAIEQ